MVKGQVQFEEKVCSCDRCKSMCKRAPCLPTPEDVKKLMDAGFTDKLEFDYMFRLDKNGGRVYPSILLIKPKRQLLNKHCIFFTKEGLCSIHDLGLKPTEGKLAIHTPKHITEYFGVADELWPKKITKEYTEIEESNFANHSFIISQWNTARGRLVIKKFKEWLKENAPAEVFQAIDSVYK